MFDELPLQLTLGQSDPAIGDNGSPIGGNGNGGAGGNGDAAGEGANGDSPLVGDPDGNQPAEQRQPSIFDGILPILILVMLAFLVMSIFSQRKEKKRRKQMLDELKKNDKVVTIGGIVGTIVELRDNEVILKVDESNNTRLHFTRAAIQGPVAGSDKDDKA